MEPTKIYLQTIAKISKNYDVVGVNNTGYGLKNFNRIAGNFEFFINNPLKPLPIFELMQKESGFSDKQMYETFNMGMGFFIVCREKEADNILQIAKEGKIVGEVRKTEKTRTVLSKEGRKTVFFGY